jgi:hypothetical protein
MNGKRNRSTLKKPILEPLCPTNIPHDLTRDRTRPAVDGEPGMNHLGYDRSYEEACSDDSRPTGLQTLRVGRL